MVERAPSVLVVDDSPDIARLHASLVEGLGYKALVETRPLRVEGRLLAEPVDALLLDIRMPELDGLALLQRIRCRYPRVGVVMATVVDDLQCAVKATKQGAFNYLLKPLDPGKLEPVLRGLFDARPPLLREEPAFANYLTTSPLFGPIFERLERFAAADVPVLIEGETGTGKELVAELLHRLSPRAEQPFTQLNIASLTPSLFASELFGYRQGAFTGAQRDHAGHIEAAGEGTLLLDEIGELDPQGQVALLRVLQERRYLPVGDTQPREARCRFVFSTNRELEASDGFRGDLYYRLAPHRVRLPPLRDRVGDIELLAEYFVRKYAVQYGRAIEGLEDSALEALRGYRFPGNVRELEGMISAAVLLERGSRVSLASLPDGLQDGQAGPPGAGAIERTRWRELRRALAECDGNQTQAAKRLGISRATICRWLKQMRESDGHGPADDVA